MYKVKTVLILLLFIVSNSYSIYAQTGSFELRGYVNIDGVSLLEASIDVFEEGVPVKTVKTKLSGSYRVSLELNKFYTVIFSKANYIPQRMKINTTVPEGRENRYLTSMHSIKLIPSSGNEKTPLISYEINSLSGDLIKIESKIQKAEVLETKEDVPNEKELESEEEVVELEKKIPETILEQMPDSIDLVLVDSTPLLLDESPNLTDSLSLTNLFLESEVLLKDFRANMYNYSINKELKYAKRRLVAVDTLKFVSLQSELNEIKKRKNKQISDSLKYLKVLVSLKQTFVDELKLSLKKEIAKAERERSLVLINSIHELLLKIEQEISIVKDEILRTQTTILEQQQIIEQAKNIRLLLVLSIAFLSILSIVFFLLYRNKKHHYKNLAYKNSIISQQNEEIIAQTESIIAQNEKLEFQQNQIFSSINYASRIQTALLPTTEQLQKSLQNYFVFYSPRDIVSGDFYWSHQASDFQIIITADSTGHGVPGAFMSALGISFLNDIIAKNERINSADILNKLREKVKHALKQSVHSESKDGMDMSVCIINKEKKELNFAGANNSLYFMRNGELTQYKADRQPIGIHLKETKFSNQIIHFERNDIFYLFSDGFADQFGGKENTKYKIRKFREFLIQISSESMIKQKELLSTEFDKWKAYNEQTDDVVVLGVKL